MALLPTEHLANGVVVDADGRLVLTNGNTETAALLTGSGAAAGANGTDQVNVTARGLKLFINVSAIAGTTPTLTVTIQGKDPVSGVYYTILASAAITATGLTVLTVYPGAPVTANVAVNDILPRTWRVISVIGGTGPTVTYTVTASTAI